jgi:hypothetical protein
LKLGSHELLYGRIQYRKNQTGRLTKGRWGLEPEEFNSLIGIRNRIVKVDRIIFLQQIPHFLPQIDPETAIFKPSHAFPLSASIFESQIAGG